MCFKMIQKSLILSDIIQMLGLENEISFFIVWEQIKLYQDN